MLACLSSIAGGDSGYGWAFTVILPFALATVILAGLFIVQRKAKKGLTRSTRLGPRSWAATIE